MDLSPGALCTANYYDYATQALAARPVLLLARHDGGAFTAIPLSAEIVPLGELELVIHPEAPTAGEAGEWRTLLAESSSIQPSRISAVWGRVSPDTLKAVLKNHLKYQTVHYYQTVHAPAQRAAFVPGVSRINYAGRVFDEAEMVNLADASLDFWLTHGPYGDRFERELAAFLGVKRAYLVNSGSSANLAAFMALTSPKLGERAVRRGDEVITVAAAFPTTVAPIIQFGAAPVFVDVELETLNVDPRFLAAALSPRTKAVMLAHTLGNPFDLDAVKDFCDAHGLWLIEDNCDALGSRYRGRYTGSFGDIGASSFYPPHHITLGEGGAVYTNDAALARILLSLRDWGRDCWCPSGRDNTCGQRFSQQFGALPLGYDHKYVYGHLGYNLKATDLQAAMGCAQLAKLPEFIRRRQENHAILYEGLNDLGEYFLFPQAAPGSDPAWFGFMLLRRDEAPFSRNDLAQHLESRHIQTRNLFGGNLLRHPAFESLQEGVDYRVVGSLPHTDKIMHDGLWVGVYPGLTRPMLDYMIATIRDFVRPGT
jgi:CDP-6-deoxy-D-xylo-4-hexulose-3-dehydrase